MNEKKKRIIETSITLIADKGFFSTSIQEIAEKSGLSKGAFYLHFRSKDELLLKIFEYYYNLVSDKMSEVSDEKLAPKENFINQLEAQFKEILKHKNFILTQIRDQAITINKDLYEFIKYADMETQKWYEANLIKIYGEKVRPHVYDLGLTTEGFKKGFIPVLMNDTIEIDAHRIATFIGNRLDDITAGILSANEEPIITKEIINPVFESLTSPEEYLKQEITDYLLEMQKVMNDLDIDEHQVSESQGVIDYLLSEIKKQEPKKFVIQGMLANLKGVNELDKYRKLIADRLDIRLI